MKVCINCFRDIELRQFIQVNSQEIGRCNFCSSEEDAELLDIVELLDFFAEFIGVFTPDQHGIPLPELIQSDWELFSSDFECNNILTEILLSLDSELTPKSNVSYIEEIIECTSYWETLKEEIKWKKRFLTNTDILDDLGWVNFFNKTYQWPHNELFYRGRLHYTDNQKEFKAEDMGCPEKNIVPAGRANPQGIPYLYLSKSYETIFYEVRATYLDEISVGTFRIKEDSNIILVDFTEKASAFSKIDEIVEFTKSMLLKRYISADLSKPIRRYDSEIEYIPTQFICEYIRYISDSDGIIFNSSLHSGGKNIVLYEQDKLECIDVKMYRVHNVSISADSEVVID
jgi:hypothetical protein